MGWDGGIRTHAEVAVPDLDAAVLAAGGDELAIAAVGAAGGRDLLPLKGAGLEHRLVLLVVVHVPRAHRAAERETDRQRDRERDTEIQRET